MIWGIILGCHAAASNFATLCALRVLLGIGEAAIVPGFTLLTGLFYKPSEHASRHGLWFYGNSFGGMFGALIAYGCAHITGGPLAAWKVGLPLVSTIPFFARADYRSQWLFIALGMVTFLWGLFIFFILPDSPLTARFLKPAQRPIANRRSQKYMHSYKSGTWSNAQFLEAMKDPKTWFLFGSITVSSLTNGVVSNVSKH
jgi:MFS family permease